MENAKWQCECELVAAALVAETVEAAEVRCDGIADGKEGGNKHTLRFFSYVIRSSTFLRTSVRLSPPPFPRSCNNSSRRPPLFSGSTFLLPSTSSCHFKPQPPPARRGPPRFSLCSVSFVSSLYGDADADPSPAAPLSLLRTSSLPTETEEERWRRREMQSRRRLEAPRKRVEHRTPWAATGRCPSQACSSGGPSPVGSEGSTSVNTAEQG
ncbi:uncharacterized protein LOC111255707 [Setaria italica]|uniref:uncharacterized protein LOC111255707 n=1 Tax=Setaria italica TaxID=4555 RepID=UPI000BE5F704|nr:uncharacterized protein LOC111255707 [Setaria italica]